ncbi:MAG: DUF2330 domain-containing protein [Planctomycetes bacterium]|nr:DUF2330 domain-containing protein [Planctomycetota bacterium]
MRYRYLKTFVVLLVSSLALPALADPCGMVPPIYPAGQPSPIARTGLQQTYVFFKDGVETFVIHPGFTGKVDEFGMLIPFPAVPAIRKVPDHIFPHIAAAVDPPEVVVDLRPRFFAKKARAIFNGRVTQQQSLQYQRDEVKVLKKEAVGMYEVAVLGAGSAKALKRWMDDHGFQFPKGMEDVCEDYILEKWCFVAVKTKVGQKEGANPKPGQRQVNTKLPDGSTFDGHVQGMGFRFEVDELVVPMRLGAFNDGDLRNIVYLMTDKPRKIRSIPEEYVVRQVSGEQLIKNVTEPLPIRIIGGTEKDIPDHRRRTLPQERNPVPHNGAAKELFASDLLASQSDNLSLPHEEQEKVLLRVGERFGLRGADIDKLNAQALAQSRDKTLKGSLAALKDMTLTVVDGDFPRELLAKQNLTFAEYRMPRKRNTVEAYDAKTNKPSGKKPGVRKIGALSPIDQDAIVGAAGGLPTRAEGHTAGQVRHGESACVRTSSDTLAWLLSAFGVGLLGMTLFIRRKRRMGSTFRIVTVFALSLALSGAAALAQDKKDADEPAKKPSVRELLRDLSDGDKAEEAVAALVKRADESKELLKGEAVEGNDFTRRGWAIVALSEIGGKEIDALLTKVHSDDKQPMLVRTWAAAARVSMTQSTDDLIAKASLISQFPALGRPIGMRVIEALKQGKETSAEGILTVSLRVPQLQGALVPTILALGPDKLVIALTGAKDQNVRRQAAAYLGTLAQQGNDKVGAKVATAYKFDPMAKKVVWSGGPLFIPGIRWSKEDARSLVGHLISWHLWCDIKGKKAEQKKIHNNIRSLGLAGAAGYRSPGFQEATTVKWLEVWGRAVGKEELAKLLKTQQADKIKKYAAVLAKL